MSAYADITMNESRLFRAPWRSHNQPLYS